jgi:FAD:protein FMN transferase
MKKTLKLLILTLLLLSLISACTDKAIKPVSLVGEAQGTYYMVTYYDAANRNLQREIDSLLKDFDMSVSLWEPESILSRINRGDTAVVPDEIFLYNFTTSLSVATETNGAFDFTISPLVKAWGFGPRERAEITPQLIDSLRELVDYRKVWLENGKVVKSDERIAFDFNAVAQGHSVDLIAQMLRGYGIENFIVDVGGEIYASGIKPDGSNWLVGIEEPTEFAGDSRTVSLIVRLENKALATSGNYRKYYEKDGMRYSHTINPQTGYPVDHNLLSVTILAENAALADAYATAFMVMGHDKAIGFVEGRSDLQGHFIWSGLKGKFESYSTDGLKKLILE